MKNHYLYINKNESGNIEIKDIFREEVADLAKSMGITNYNLTVE